MKKINKDGQALDEVMDGFVMSYGRYGKLLGVMLILSIAIFCTSVAGLLNCFDKIAMNQKINDMSNRIENLENKQAINYIEQK